MNYIYAFHTDVGIQKSTNQDSLCIKEAETDQGTLLMAIMCDGMGGLEKGEVASKTVIKAFSDWFENKLAFDLAKAEPVNEVKYKWERMIKQLNQDIAEYGRKYHLQLGTTISAFLIFEDGKYLIGHVGDSRVYEITDTDITALTEDQTVVANEVKNGRLTQEEAASDPRKNVLLQCIGASKVVEPVFSDGQITRGSCYMLCSDGFRHLISSDEIHSGFAPDKNHDELAMKHHIVELIEENKNRGETDNISVILIKNK